MSELRRSRVQSAIEREVSIYLKNFDDPMLKEIFVTHVEVSSDLHYAKIFYTVLGKEDQSEEIMKSVAKVSKKIQKDIAFRLKDMRKVPLLSFHFDLSIQKGDRVLKILESIEKEIEEKNE
jgi:ribosome-binding factor A